MQKTRTQKVPRSVSGRASVPVMAACRRCVCPQTSQLQRFARKVKAPTFSGTWKPFGVSPVHHFEVWLEKFKSGWGLQCLSAFCPPSPVDTGLLYNPSDKAPLPFGVSPVHHLAEFAKVVYKKA